MLKAFLAVIKCFIYEYINKKKTFLFASPLGLGSYAKKLRKSLSVCNPVEKKLAAPSYC